MTVQFLMLLAALTLIPESLAQPVGQKNVPLKCFHALSLGSSTPDELVAAYQYTLSVSDLSVQDLRFVFEAGVKQVENFFIVPENGSVKRGQIQSALSTLKNLATVLSFEDKEKLKKQLASSVQEAIQNHETTAQEQVRGIKDIERFATIQEIANLDGRVDYLMSSNNKVFAVLEHDQNKTSRAHVLDVGTSGPYFRQSLYAGKGLATNVLNQSILINRGETLELHNPQTGSTSEIIRIPRVGENFTIQNSKENYVDQVARASSYRFYPETIALSSDGKFVVAVIGGLGLIYTWEEGIGQRGPFYPYSTRVTDYRGKRREIKRVFIFPNEKTAVVVEGMSSTFLWSPEKPDGTRAFTFNLQSWERVWAFSPVSNLLVIVENNAARSPLTIWDYKQATSLHQIDEPGGAFRITISANEKWVAVISYLKNLIRIRSLKNPSQFVEISLPNQNHLAFTPDSKTLLMTGSDGVIRSLKFEDFFIERFGEVQ